MKKVLSIASLPLASNVCNQQLREVFKTNVFSLAHVIMALKAESLLHKHYRTTELYFIISGQGVLTHGTTETRVSAGACIEIPPTVEHKLKNTGEGELVHFVVALPPFRPEDVEIIKYSREIMRFGSFVLPETFVGLDGGRVYEFPKISWQHLGMSLAYGYLEPKQRARSHFHKETKEWYFIVEGMGRVFLDDEVYEIQAGELITVPAGVKHSLQNTTSVPLRVLCICEPHFSEDDFYFAD